MFTHLVILATFLATYTLAIPAFLDPIPVNNSLTTNETITKRTIGGAKICTLRDLGGTCFYGVFKLDTCVYLRGYTSLVGSFIPDSNTACFLMQDKCNWRLDHLLFYDDPYKNPNLNDAKWADSYCCYKYPK